MRDPIMDTVVIAVVAFIFFRIIKWLRAPTCDRCGDRLHESGGFAVCLNDRCLSLEDEKKLKKSIKDNSQG